jgi:Protein phosphatase 2C
MDSTMPDHPQSAPFEDAPWRFARVDAVCEAGDTVNDDRGTALPGCAWVLDGTTGLTPVRLFPGPSDAAWFAEAADRLLHRLAPAAGDGASLLRELVQELRRECARSIVAADDGPEVDRPAASLALARLTGGTLGTVMLGDCKILLRRRDGSVEALDRSGVAPFDARVVAALTALQRAGELDLGRIKPKLASIIRENRRSKNRPGGYGVLADDPACLAFAEIAHWPAAEFTHVLIASDGFYRLVDTYQVMTPASLMAAAPHLGVGPLYRELRRLEDADPNCIAHPRIKPRDDATALLLRLELG